MDKSLLFWPSKLYCRLYQGEDVLEYESLLKKVSPSFREPFPKYNETKSNAEIQEILAQFYYVEKLWIKQEDPEDLAYLKMLQSARGEFETYFTDDFEENDGTPYSLKVFHFLVSMQWLDGTYQRFTGYYEAKLFEHYYKDYYQKIPTLLQIRDAERRPALLKKCSYYKGEEKDPWEFCYSPVLVWRSKMWYVEKEWVDAMVRSYHCPQSSKQLIEDFVLKEFFKSKGIALSLLNLILTKEKEKADNKNEYFGPAEAIKIYEKYKKMVPLGRDHRLYFAYYMGEEKAPFKYDEVEEYVRMGWSQEELQRDHLTMLCDFENDEFMSKYKGEKGVWGWYADSKFPLLQKQLLYFMCCNWGRWCPYSDVDKLAEQYLNYHYPGAEKAE